MEYNILCNTSKTEDDVVRGEAQLARILTENELKDEIGRGELIENASLDCAEGIKYDFRLSDRILKSSVGAPINLSEMTAVERSKTAVEPGEVVFVLTEEKLCLNNDIIVTLSPKRKLSHEGVQILGGLCVDPLYRGHLLIGLHNFSSEPFRLIPGKKLIAGVFQRLTDTELMEFKPPETEINDFPSELISLIKNYQPVGTQELLNKVDNLSSEVGLLRSVIDDDKKWREGFQDYLDEHNKQIGDLLKGLAEEKKNREGAHGNLNEKLNEQKLSNSNFISKASISGVILLVIAGALIGEFVRRLFE